MTFESNTWLKWPHFNKDGRLNADIYPVWSIDTLKEKLGLKIPYLI